MLKSQLAKMLSDSPLLISSIAAAFALISASNSSSRTSTQGGQKGGLVQFTACTSEVIVSELQQLLAIVS